jgi:hypothetical protein
MLLKHHGFFDRPITQASNCSEASVLLVKASVIRSFAFFPPARGFVVSVRFRDDFQLSPVSSILRILRYSYLAQRARTPFICSIASGKSIATDSPSLCITYSLILNRALNPPSQLFDYFGSSWSAYCGNILQNLVACAFKRSPVIVAFFLSIRWCYSNSTASSSGQSPTDDLFESSWSLSFFLSRLLR